MSEEAEVLTDCLLSLLGSSDASLFPDVDSTWKVSMAVLCSATLLLSYKQ